MKALSTNILADNTYFDKPVFLDKHYILLTPEIPVALSLINRLRKWNINEIYSDGSLTENPDIGSPADAQTEVASLDQNLAESETYTEISVVFSRFAKVADDFFKSFFLKNALDIATITQNIKEIINMIKKDRDILLGFLGEDLQFENYLISHTINSSILSIALGDFLKFPPHRLIELGLAAFLHEIGMIKLPSNLYSSERALTPKEKQTIMAHTELGYRILKSFSVNDKVAQTALEHHERTDGSGYPRGLKGEEISVYSRIVAVACSYDSLITERPFKDAKSSFTGLLELLKEKRTTYDENILKALIYVLSVYPIGSGVLLSNGSKGIVYRSNPQNPKYPVIKLLVDKEGNKVKEHAVIKTDSEEGITIAKLIDRQDLS